MKEISGYDRQLSAMQELDIPLLVHGESHGFVLDREQEFLAVYRTLAKRYPRLRIVMEHITTAAAAALLDEFENLYATRHAAPPDHYAKRCGWRAIAAALVLQAHRQASGGP